jgi:hypothetical protein
LEIALKRLTLFVIAALIGSVPIGCKEDLNKNVPKSLPPGAKPFQTTDKNGGAPPENQQSQDRAK